MVEYAENTAVTKGEAQDFPSRPEVLIEIRRMVESAAAHTSLQREAIDDLLTAVDEAAANAIRHGAPSDENAHIRVTCHYTPEFLEVSVRDFGDGFTVPDMPIMPSPEAMGGRGLPLMVALADTVSIQSTAAGTTVTLNKRHTDTSAGSAG